MFLWAYFLTSISIWSVQYDIFFEVSICSNSYRPSLWYSCYLVWPQEAAPEDGSVRTPRVAHLAAYKGPSGTPVFEIVLGACTL